MRTNTAGSLSIDIRAGIGKGLLVRAVMVVISVVTDVPQFIVTVRMEVASALTLVLTRTL